MKKLLLIIFALYTSTLFAQMITVYNFSTLSRPPIFGTSPFQNGGSVDTTGGSGSANGGVGGYDTSSNALIYNAVAQLPGFTITGINSLTTHPHTGEMFAICKVSAVSGRVLCKYSPLTAVMTQVGNLGDNFSSITFGSDGTLYGATGDGASVSEALYTIDPLTAAKTLKFSMGNGNDGEVIAYNHTDNHIYHWSGNGTVVFEKWPASNVAYTPTNIPIIGTTNGETFGTVYLGGNKFRTSNISSSWNNFLATGNVSANFGSNYDDMRGLALVARWVNRIGSDTICANDSSLFEAMASSGITNNHKFQWVKNGVNIPGATSPTYYANQTGWYNCRIILDSLYTNTQTMDSAITVYTDTAWFGRNLFVNPLPVVNLTPTPTAYFCFAGDSILLTGSSGGTSQWYMNGSMIPSANTNTYYASIPGSYNMTKTNLNGCTDTSAVPTSVLLAPSPSLLSSTGGCFGDSVLLTANSGSASYNWLLNGTSFTTTTIETIYVNADGNYSVETTFGSCIDTTAATAIDFAPQYNVTPNGSGSICIGSNQTLTATAGGSSYQWTMNGANIGGATSATYNATATGIYECIITFPTCTDTTVSQFSLTAVDCSGIEENTSVNINLYPNPVHEKLNISVSNNVAIQQIDIIDLSGRKVMSAKPNSTNTSVNVEGLRSGTYMITITTENGIKTKRFIKN